MVTIHYTQTELIELLCRAVAQDRERQVNAVTFRVTATCDALDRPTGAYDVQCDVDVGEAQSVATGGVYYGPSQSVMGETLACGIPVPYPLATERDERELVIPLAPGEHIPVTLSTHPPSIIVHIHHGQDAHGFRATQSDITRRLVETLRRHRSDDSKSVPDATDFQISIEK